MSHDPLETRSRELFEDQVSSQDARTRSRLNQARHAALAAAGGNDGRELQRWLLPVGSAAALALMTVVAVQRDGVQTPDAAVAQLKATDSVDDMEIMLSGDELDMLKDMDFYAWLDTQSLDEATGEATGGAADGAG